MAKNTIKYYCSNCGNEFSKWQGKCQYCKEFNTIVEYKEQDVSSQALTSQMKIEKLEDVDSQNNDFLKTEIVEVDQLLNGGIVDSSLTLLGGQPGIGKSTLLLQIVANLSKSKKVLYISGEETTNQIKMRAKRLGVDEAQILLATTNNLTEIFKNVLKHQIEVLIIDSIQTVYSEEFGQVPGTTTQLKNCTLALMTFAKVNKVTTIIIGHVTKDGEIAGPKLLEHMVDTVIYLEGQRDANQRIMRVYKNRYGSTDKLGLFEIRENGLLSKTSIDQKLLISEQDVIGYATGLYIDGNRIFPIIVESLIDTTAFGHPKRISQNLEVSQLYVTIAIISQVLDMSFINTDVFVRIDKKFPKSVDSLDFALLAAIVSSKLNKALNQSDIFIGSVALNGQVKKSSNGKQMIEYALTLGYKRIFISKQYQSQLKSVDNIIFIENIKELLRYI